MVRGLAIDKWTTLKTFKDDMVTFDEYSDQGRRQEGAKGATKWRLVQDFTQAKLSGVV